MSSEDDNAQVILGAIALVISLVALLAAVLQILQTYFASATGFARCSTRIMGEWGNFTKRIPRPTELRFEVQFEAPVIFLAPPNNVRGPVPDEKIWYIDGSDDSRKETRILLPAEHRKQEESLSKKKRIHTADNERASWVDLLAAAQQMEHDSQEWQRNFYYAKPGKKSPKKFSERTLAVAVQKKTKSWDTMPSSMTKPYATTTMCHLIELAAVLGLYWKEFSRSENKYRAEGNGYILTGSVVNELGIVFSFQKTARTTFEEDRVIPREEVKQLCFGVVNTIFCDEEDEREERFKYPFDVPQNLAALQLGSSREIADTLTVMGCNTNTANYFLQEDRKISHLFPIPFELLGMLGRTLHGHGSGFRMLPNPTIYGWERKSFSMWKLLEAYEDNLEDDYEIGKTDQIRSIQKSADNILKIRGRNQHNSELSIPIMDALHDALDMSDKFLGTVREHFILGVLRWHFQVLLDQLNAQGSADKFGELNRLNLEDDKQRKFMDIYFNDIRKEVVNRGPTRLPTFYAPKGDPMTPRAETPPVGTPPATPPSSIDDKMPSIIRSQTNYTPHDQLNDIWCTLVFRMLCWLLLHDFHKQDIQKPKSELLGSRLPVYIV